MAKRRPAGAAITRKPPVEHRKAAPRFNLRDAGLWALILCAALLAYLPALHGGLVWDDSGHVTRPEMRSLHGLWRIWSDVTATQQYYPLLHSAFWLEHHLWGDAVLGYHLTNVFLHALSAFLLVLIMRSLSLPGGWLAGLVFALHPVCVEAVAWISEQKSALSGVFYLASALAYLRFDRTRKTPHYALAAGLFVLALLSKTVTASLPAALLVVLWWKRGRIELRRDVLPLLPWFAAGAAAGLFTAWVEKTYIGAEGADFTLNAGQRLLLAGRVILFYASKVLWPANLMFTYPRWEIDAGVWWQYLFPAAVLTAGALLLRLARRNRGPLAGFLFFGGTLFPVLGFLNVYPFRFSYVADHFQYLACLGLIVPLAAVAVRLPIDRIAKMGLAAAVPLVLGTLTYLQAGSYRDAETLYRDTLARNPDSWMARNNLGYILAHKPGGLADAIVQYQAALSIKPDYAGAHLNLGNAFAQMPGRLPEAIAEYEAALRIRPNYPEARNSLGSALLEMPGRLEDSIAEFRAALRLNPNYPEAHNNLGYALSRTPERLAEAVEHYRASLRIRPESAAAHYNLATALAKMPGRQQEAIAEYEEALRIRPDLQRAREKIAELRKQF